MPPLYPQMQGVLVMVWHLAPERARPLDPPRSLPSLFTRTGWCVFHKFASTEYAHDIPFF